MAVAYASSSGASLASLGSTDLVIDKPAGTVEGDLLTCFIILSANVTITPPAGWTVEVNASGVKAYRKIAGASEPASYTFVRGTITNTLVGQIARLTGVDTADPIDTIAALASAGSNTAVLPSVNVTDGFFLWQQVAVLSNSTWTPPGTATEAYDFQPPTQSHAVAGGHETVGAGATGTRTWTSTSTGTRSGVVRAIRAASVPPVSLTASATGGGTAAAQTRRTIQLTAMATGAGTGQAVARRTVHAQATAAGGGTAAASLSRVVTITATAPGGGQAAGTARRTVRLTGSSSGGGSSTAALTVAGKVALTASASGSGLAAATHHRTVRATAQATGGGAAAAPLLRSVHLAASATGAGAATAVISGPPATPSLERTTYVAAEDRAHRVPTEVRTTVIPAENRTSKEH